MRVQKVAGHVLPGVHDDQHGLPGAQPINERVLLFPGDRKSLPIQDRVPFPVQCEVGSRPRRNIETRAFGRRGQKMSRNQETRHRHNQQTTPTPTKNAQQQQGCSTTPSWDRHRTNLASPATAHPPPRTIKRSSSPPHMRGVPARPRFMAKRRPYGPVSVGHGLFCPHFTKSTRPDAALPGQNRGLPRFEPAAASEWSPSSRPPRAISMSGY